MNILDFLKYVSDNPNLFIRYCEIVMGKYGEIYLATPSHTEKLIELAAKKNNVSKEAYKYSIPVSCDIIDYIVSKEKLIALWFNIIHYPKSGMNRFQKRSLKLLVENHIVNLEFYRACDEYEIHLWRQKEYGID